MQIVDTYRGINIVSNGGPWLAFQFNGITTYFQYDLDGAKDAIDICLDWP
jgi:hypothetical protein